VAQLRRWNNLRGSALVPGHSLYVSEPARLSGLRYGRRRHHGAKTGGKATTKTAAANHAPKKPA
ncbi:MAG: hypothetical protein WCC27_20820, partial [Acidobacteriaceae bacterium]